ncbi:MAG: ATP-binding cassette domain-containing protein [Halothiobacillus sp.]|nr:ATP-binding cassette domain-containing protein [Halothiobacillus sp.]
MKKSVTVAAPVIRAQGLVKQFGRFRAVDGIDFTIPPGQCFGFLGPNGAGKTTTLKMLMGLADFDEGSLSVLGQALPDQARAIRALVGLVPQADNLDPDFTVRENLFMYARFFGLKRAAVADRVEALLAFSELAAKADAKVETLSGGMKRRLTIARALINDPEIVILDEPTTGLDPQVRHLIWAAERQGTAVYVYTHAPAPILEFLGDDTDLTVIHRRAGLEDVFLRLTGRGLRE